MKFSELWLRSHADPALDSLSLAHALTMAGLEVDAIEPVAAKFSGVVIGQVLDISPHPNADRLRICRVDVGSGEPLQIVCGAPNVSPGVRVPCARIGAKLPGMDIRATKLRGVDSFGMLCSGKELGIDDPVNGLLLLPTSAPIGLSLREYLQLDDHSITLKLTPNRSDCLGILGIAREVAAITGCTLQPLPTPVEHYATESSLDIAVLAPDACPLYCAQLLTGLNPQAATPDWMRLRLTRSGIRSLGAIVDITNYVMLETGQPLHAFDADLLHGGIVVRWAHAAENITLLNGQQLALDPDMLVIADHHHALALAGIMGGQSSGVRNSSTRVVLESAFFTPDALVGRARRCNINTDASFRFERGVDYMSTPAALQRATHLILSICGGHAEAATEVRHTLPVRAPIALRIARVSKILGIDIAADDMVNYLTRLGCVVHRNGETLGVTPPSHRFDITSEIDLIEELVRLNGYERLPATSPVGTFSMLTHNESKRSTAKLATLLAARDYQEVITYSFVNTAWEAALNPHHTPVPLKNPIASHMNVMRSNLMGGLLDVLHTNLNRGQQRVRIFEIGHCFIKSGQIIEQPLRISGLAYGEAAPEQWGQPGRHIDFFDVKADIEALCWPQTVRMEADPHPALHPRQCARIILNGHPIGWLGSLHPEQCQHQQLTTAPILFELNMRALMICHIPTLVEPSRFQHVRRDIALIVDQDISAQAMLDAMTAAAIPNVVDVAIFDHYRGKHIDSDKKSLAFSVLMQDNHKTLVDEDVERVITQLTALLQQQFHAQIRT